MTGRLESKRLKKDKESSAKGVEDVLFHYDEELIIKLFKNKS